MRFFTRKQTGWLAVALTASVVLLPYIFSRLRAASTQITTISMPVPSAYPDAATEHPPRHLRVAAYNIAHGRGLVESNWEGGDAETRLSRLDAIAALLIEIDADLVVLNEIDVDASWSYGVNQLEYLMRRAGYPHGVHGRNTDFRIVHRTWRFGNAVMSRHPITNPQVIDFPAYRTHEAWLAGKKRGLFCDIAVGDNTIRVIAAHLSHRSEDVREQSAQAILQVVNTSPHPCVLAGDMNAAPDGFPRSMKTTGGRNAMRTFDQSGVLSRWPTQPPPGPNELTFPADAPDRVIDWILVSDPLQITAHEVVDSTLSDHRPVVSDIQW